jgi:heme/copper-type cytochrome/quinol oxidase subunit 2
MTIHPVGRAGAGSARRITDSSWWRFAVGLGALAAACTTLAFSPQEDDSRRDISIAAKQGAFQPAKIEVRQNDLVKVTFTADDGPHSFNVDAYRIAKRARPGHPAVFEFRADQAGTFPYYCNLSEAGGTHDMRGELVVTAR